MSQEINSASFLSYTYESTEEEIAAARLNMARCAARKHERTGKDTIGELMTVLDALGLLHKPEDAKV